MDATPTKTAVPLAKLPSPTKSQKLAPPPPQPTRDCKKRIKKDMKGLIREPLPGICACLNEGDFTKVGKLPEKARLVIVILI